MQEYSELSIKEESTQIKCEKSDLLSLDDLTKG